MADARPSLGLRFFRLLKELVLIVAIALALSLLLKTFFFQSFYIPSASMEGTLQEGDRILVTKWKPGPLDMRRGDIVVFKDPGGWLVTVSESAKTDLPTPVENVLTWVGLLPEDAGEHLVKRIIGLPGDHVVCCDAQGLITVNGIAMDEPYLADGVAPSETEFDITVPADSLWVMGDNRPNSADSRAHRGNPGGGSVPIDNVVGVAFANVWPLSRWSGLGNPYSWEQHDAWDAAAGTG